MAESTVFTQLKTDMKIAMKARESERLGTIRLLISALKNKQIDGGGDDLTEEQVISVLSSEAKKRRDAITAYRGTRDELADQEERELAWIQGYLPAQLEEAEVTAMVVEVIAAVGAESKKDMGKVMKEMVPKTKGRFDGKKLKDIVMAKLP